MPQGNADPGDDYWLAELGEPVDLPPLADLPSLHSLDVGGLAVLPPDWRQLTSLRQLSLRPLLPEEPQPEAHDFGQPVTALAALTQLRLPDAHLTPALCELGGLRDLSVKAGEQLPTEVTRLTSLTSLSLFESRNEAAAPAPLPQQLCATLRRLNVSCMPARQEAWSTMLREADAGAQVRMNFLPEPSPRMFQ